MALTAEEKVRLEELNRIKNNDTKGEWSDLLSKEWLKLTARESDEVGGENSRKREGDTRGTGYGFHRFGGERRG